MKKWRFVLAILAAATIASPALTFAGDAFFKGGLTFHPDVGGVGERWFISLGSDWSFHPMGFIGVEFQSAYHSSSALGIASVKTVPVNLLLNGKWKSQGEAVRPYAGVGVGLVSSYVRTEFLGVTDDSYVKDAGFQLMGGVELNRKWLVELLGQRVLEDGAEFSWSILGGIRW